MAFCKKLTGAAAATGLVPDGYVFRLPTEAEWEYCCRAGTKTATAFGDSLSSEQANFDGNYPYGGAKKGPYLERTSDVGSYPPTPGAIRHARQRVGVVPGRGGMGRRREDRHVCGRRGRPGVQVGRRRVLRGGSWFIDGGLCRSASRHAYEPGVRDDFLGFRVCLARSPAGSEP